jgi:starch phosphorylase
MATRSFRTFTVLPSLPPRLQPLHRLAYNLWYAWHPEAINLFRRVDADLFDETDHSPVKLLGRVEQHRLEALLHDDGFLTQMDHVLASFDAYMSSKATWFHETFLARQKAAGAAETDEAYRTAYFSMEFGIHESVPVYSGGLGVLSGDHLKSASDLGLPLVGVCLMYREGYFRQYLTGDGWQQERYPENDFFNLPLIAEMTSDGHPLIISVPFPGREVHARIWRLQVGRVPLYLLDTNIPRNTAEDRGITARLYGGDTDMRIRQEMILGIGGIRALRALNRMPVVCHMNEGHSAFCGLERIRMLMEQHHLDFASAREAVTAGTVFTTHTPVPAGNDSFDPALMDRYFGTYYPALKIDRTTFLGLGRVHPANANEPFGMTVLALRLSNVANGVSKLHGIVSRRMWQSIWADLPESEVPILSITNGIHTRSWVSGDMQALYERYLGLRWDGRPESKAWERIDRVPDAELWRTHERRRERLVAFARLRLRKQLQGRGATPAEVALADEVLDPEALTIGFARRFATYKRGTLIFANLDRLATILNAKDRPVQIIFSGKAHPRDHNGKELIAQILQLSRRPELRRRIVFLEDYDMNVARYLVQGVDVWLNNPRRPLEASGTSGMKVCANGGLNLSVLDGWWDEAYTGDNGFAIGKGEEYSDHGYQDEIESRSTYDLLEQELVPLFYQRGPDGLPRGWLKMMKKTIRTLAPVFNTGRMVSEYQTTAYAPSALRYASLTENHLKGAKALAEWRRTVLHAWPQIHVEEVRTKNPGHDPLHVGGHLEVIARILLGDLTPKDVEVQLYCGRVDNAGQIPHPTTVEMRHNGHHDGKVWIYTGTIPCDTTGQHGFAVRVLPSHPSLPSVFEPGLVVWG